MCYLLLNLFTMCRTQTEISELLLETRKFVPSFHPLLFCVTGFVWGALDRCFQFSVSLSFQLNKPKVREENDYIV